MPEAVLHCGDCLEWMRGQPDDSVDLVVCSPPYEDARTYGIGFRLRGDDWVDWSVKRFVECVRICRGMVCWVVDGKTRNFQWSATPALLMARLHRAGVHLRKPPAFYRVGIPGSGGPDWFRNDYEFIVCGSKGGKLPWSDNTACGHPPKWGPGGEMSYRLSNGSRRNKWGNTDCATSMEGRSANGQHKTRTKKVITRERDGVHSQESTIYEPPVKANPGNSIRRKYTADEVVALLEEASDFRRFIVGGGVMGSELAHENEAPFPEALAEFLIRSLCPPKGIVLDPFSGSGTTGKVALQHGRNYIGIDIRQSQVDLTRRRLAEVQRDTTSLS